MIALFRTLYNFFTEANEVEEWQQWVWHRADILKLYSAAFLDESYECSRRSALWIQFLPEAYEKDCS